ncbi:metallophosphoesterase, partial [Fructobacillus ficulneus]|uniref:metallophosphoesterase n=1 Tax=Fructobacillus ficulneus TaxID=157463 RepID=UPI000784A225
MLKVQGLPPAQRYAFFSDVHGSINHLQQLVDLPEWSDPQVRFVFLGDVVDGHGDVVDVRAALAFLMDHQDKITWVLGNHDYFLLETARANPREFYRWVGRNNGSDTLRNLGYQGVLDPEDEEALQAVAEFLTTEYGDLVQKLADLPNAVENEGIIGLHAGIDWSEKYWQETSQEKSLWIREPYYYDETGDYAKNKTDKVIVTGHTPVEEEETFPQNQGQSTIVTMRHGGVGSGDVPRYVIDGGCSLGLPQSRLNVLILKA